METRRYDQEDNNQFSEARQLRWPEFNRLENFPEQEAREVQEILSYLEDKIPPEVLSFVVKSIRRLNQSEYIDGTDKLKAACWNQNKKDIVLFNEFFIDPDRKKPRHSEVKKHILLHEVAHSLIDAGVIDLKQFKSIIQNSSEDLDPDWIKEYEPGDPQDKIVEKMAERLTSVFLENEGIGSVDRGVDLRMSQMWQASKNKFAENPELFKQMLEETDELFAFFYDTFKDLTSARLQAMGITEQPYGSSPEEVYETGEQFQKNDENPEPLVEALYSREKIFNFASSGGGKKLNDLELKNKSVFLQEDAPEILTIYNAYFHHPENLAKILFEIEKQIKINSDIITADPTSKNRFGERNKLKTKFAQLLRESGGQKSVEAMRGYWQTVIGYFQNPPHDDIKKAYYKITLLEELKQQIMEQKFINELSKAYTQKIGFSGTPWEPIGVSGGQQRGRGTYLRFISEVIDPVTLQYLIDLRDEDYKRAKTVKQNGKEIKIYNKNGDLNRRFITILTMMMLEIEDEPENIEIVRKIYQKGIYAIAQNHQLTEDCLKLFEIIPNKNNPTIPDIKSTLHEKIQKILHTGNKEDELRAVFPDLMKVQIPSEEPETPPQPTPATGASTAESTQPAAAAAAPAASPATPTAPAPPAAAPASPATPPAPPAPTPETPSETSPSGGGVPQPPGL